MKKDALLYTEFLTSIVFIVATILFISYAANGFSTHSRKVKFKKAINALNDAISLNIENERGSAFDYPDRNSNLRLANYITLNLKSAKNFEQLKDGSTSFYIEDNIQYILPYSNKTAIRCGTKGLKFDKARDIDKVEPCSIIVDVNGKNGPNKLSDEKTIKDRFLIKMSAYSVYPARVLETKIYNDEI